MKAISLWEPWATMIALGAKEWETRSRRIHHRGPIAICAAQRWNADAFTTSRTWPFWQVLSQFRMTTEEELRERCGKIVAIAHVADCISTTDWLRLHCKTPTNPKSDREYCFGNYAPGRFAWKLQNVRRLSNPLPVRGRQFIWTLSEAEEAEAIRRAA